MLPFAAFRPAMSARTPFTQQCLRCFSTTTPQAAKTVKPYRLPTDLIPPYPYGERRIYKQSNRGLYGQARIRFGHNVAHKHNNKTRRFWRPNIHVKRFFVPSLGANIKTRLTLRVLKTIRREGGLENYVLKNKPARIKDLGPGGWNLRWLVMQTQAVQERFNDERVALGLEPKPVEDRTALIQYALDYATPGPLNATNRATQELLREQAWEKALGDAFILGNEAELEEAEDVEELSDEAEEILMKELDELEGEVASLNDKAESKQPEA